MPDPTFKIDGATVLSKSGTTVSVDSGVKFPAGHIIQTKLEHFAPVTNSDNDTIVITNNGGSWSNPDNLNSTQNRYFGGWPNDNRVIAEILKVSRYVKSITREKLFNYLNSELPYNLFVESVIWKETKSSITIHQNMKLI